MIVFTGFIRTFVENSYATLVETRSSVSFSCRHVYNGCWVSARGSDVFSSNLWMCLSAVHLSDVVSVPIFDSCQHFSLNIGSGL